MRWFCTHIGEGKYRLWSYNDRYATRNLTVLISFGTTYVVVVVTCNIFTVTVLSNKIHGSTRIRSNVTVFLSVAGSPIS
jgi:hypothetical protein